MRCFALDTSLEARTHAKYVTPFSCPFIYFLFECHAFYVASFPSYSINFYAKFLLLIIILFSCLAAVGRQWRSSHAPKGWQMVLDRNCLCRIFMCSKTAARNLPSGCIHVRLGVICCQWKCLRSLV